MANRVIVTKNYEVKDSNIVLDIQADVRINLYDGNPSSTISMRNNSGVAITLYTKVADKIEDEDTYTLAIGEQATFQRDSDGKDWFVLNSSSSGNYKELASQLNSLTNNGTITERVVLTQTEYDALVIAGTTVATTEYIIVG